MSRCVFKFFLFLMCFLPFATFAQQKDKKELLQQQRAKLMDEIQLANRILKDTRNDQKLTASQVQTFAQKIRIREQLIRNIRKEIELIDKEVVKQEAEIQQLEVQIEALKAEYAKLIQNAYRSRNKSSKLLYVMASEDFTQALRRVQYLRKYSAHRKDQVARITEKQTELERRVADLQLQKQEKERLRGTNEAEKKSLVTEKVTLDQAVVALRGQEKDLLKSIDQKKREAQKLDQQIEKIIAAEMRRAREEAERKALEKSATEVGLVKGKDYQVKTKNKDLANMIEKRRKDLAKTDAEGPAQTSANTAPKDPAPTYSMTPEAQLISNNFVANKSKLPWPVERGVMVRDFGAQRHHVATQVEIFNSGIDIATEKGAIARAVFDGEVTSVIGIPGSALKAVILKHGNYFTVYSNLIAVNVKVGDKVAVKQAIGEIYTNEEQNESILHFQLWKDMDKLDPKTWLVK